MDNESKLIIEKLMQENLVLKALLHKSGIIFDETDESKKVGQGFEQSGKTQIKQNLINQAERTALPKEPEIKLPNPLDDKSPLVSQKALSSNTVLSAEERLSVFASLFRGRNMYAKRWESVTKEKSNALIANSVMSNVLILSLQ